MSKIKTFKEYIKENLWSDLQDRSSGEVIRKEDDVNLLDLEGMYEYLNSHYRTKYTLITIIEKYNEMIIPIVYRSYPYYITVDFTKHHISVQDSLFLVMPDLMYIIEKEFKLSKYGTRFDQSIRFRIEPKDGSETTNRFLLDVIDFINSKISTQKKCLIKKRLNENLWADLQDRSSGEITRKEDDINHLEFDEFFVYLKDRYEKINGRGAQIGHFRSLYILSILNIVLSIEKGENIYIKYDENKHQILYLEISNALLRYPKIKQKLEQNYKRYMHDSVVKKSGKITNQDCVNLIDYFLDVVDKPVLKKKS